MSLPPVDRIVEEYDRIRDSDPRYRYVYGINAEVLAAALEAVEKS